MNRRTDPQPYWRCTGPIRNGWANGHVPKRSPRPILLYLIGVALVLFALALASVVQAAEAWDTTVVNWTQPAECKVGTVCTIGGYELQSAASATAGAWTSVVTVAPTLRTYKINGVPPGTRCYRLIASIAPTVPSGSNSDPSELACKTTVAPPSVPAAPLITVAQAAYKLDIGYQDQYKLVLVGFVPFKHPCIAQGAMGLNVVAIGPRKVIDGKKTSPYLRDASGNLVSAPMQVLAQCRPA